MRRRQRRPDTSPFMISFVGPSNTGKTTLLARLIREFSQRGLLVGAVKHSRSCFQFDIETKDSFLLKKAGARSVLLASPDSIALIADHEGDLSPRGVADRFFANTDIVLIEGWKQSDLPKIKISGRGASPAGVKNLIAEVGKKGTSSDVPLFAPHEIVRLADFILSFSRLKPPRIN